MNYSWLEKRIYIGTQRAWKRPGAVLGTVRFTSVCGPGTLEAHHTELFWIGIFPFGTIYMYSRLKAASWNQGCSSWFALISSSLASRNVPASNGMISMHKEMWYINHVLAFITQRSITLIYIRLMLIKKMHSKMYICQ